VLIAHQLELWHVDLPLHAELCPKHCCLLEAKAKKTDLPGEVEGVPVTFLLYNRSQLLTCQEELEKTMEFVRLARERRVKGSEGAVEGKSLSENPDADLAVIHAECLYALTRIQVKLASTNPPPSKIIFQSH